MASGLFDSGRNRFARGDTLWKASAGSTIKAALIDIAVVAPNLGTHMTMSDLRSAVVGSDGAMTLIDPAAGVADANDVVFSAVSGAHVEGVVIFHEVSASDANRFLLAWEEFTVVTPNVGDITVTGIGPWGDALKLRPDNKRVGKEKISHVTLNPLDWSATLQFGVNVDSYEAWMARVAAGAHARKR